jgi:NADH-quinone oxidoreductase subunit L
MEPHHLMLAILLTPLVSATLIAFFFRRQALAAGALSIGASGLILGLTIWLFAITDLSTPAEVWTVEWLRFGDYALHLGFLLDQNTTIMLFVVAFVGFLIHVFSWGYMMEDDARGRYFGGLSIFMFSMLGIVLADSLLMIFFFWELVGFSSYMLIAHYFKERDAAMASKKAFIVNRIGDLGFLVGMVWAYWYYGTFSLTELQAVAGTEAYPLVAGIALCLMGGFLGKSAHFPLHVWLPDAMAGPTPVSALIHAATMVAAGIYFLVRIYYLFPAEVLMVVAWLGVGMTVYAGMAALAQRDIKKILAYSTLSQLGFMAAALGMGFPGIALFHMATHAFFKALLFLGSGSVINACHHEKDIFKMGGLLKRMPITSITFGLGVLSISGVTFLAGYWSKDSILLAAYVNHPLIFWFLLYSAAITALYMGRMYWVAFLGAPKSEAADHAKESPLVMTIPLIVLAVLAVVGGFYALWPEVMSTAFSSEYKEVHYGEAYKAAHAPLLILGTLAWIIGLVGSFLFYRPGAREDHLEKLAPPVYSFIRSRLYLDEIYNWYVAKVQQRFADMLAFLDLIIITGIFVRGSAALVGLVGLAGRRVHQASVHAYIFWFLIGSIILFAVAVFRP